MKQKIVYVCTNCGNLSPKWSGKCNVCGEWDTFVEEISTKKGRMEQSAITNTTKLVKLTDISNDREYRISTNIPELDRVLGGGIVPGSVILAAGDPGIGKSTLLLQMCSELIDLSPIYVTGEESLEQIKLRADRLGYINSNISILAETNAERINQIISASESRLIILDSIQSFSSDAVNATAGSIIQVRECASLFIKTAKLHGKTVFFVGHVTKEGIIAGPKILEHMVDTVLQFEGEKTNTFRILRALKNRFGSTNEIGIFEMSETGLKEVTNPSEIFLAHRKSNEPGIALVAGVEGTRPIILEIQALVSPTGYGIPQRTSNGYDAKRLQMLIAVLEKRLGLNFRYNDVFINVAGGIYINDTSVDLGLAVALVSSFKEKPVPEKYVLAGEIGLTGEIRPVTFIEQRIAEAEKLGFENILIPGLNYQKVRRNFNINILPVDKISLALMELL